MRGWLRPRRRRVALRSRLPPLPLLLALRAQLVLRGLLPVAPMAPVRPRLGVLNRRALRGDGCPCEG